MSSFFALIVTVCALTGECSDIMLGVYQTEELVVMQLPKSSVKKCVTHINRLETNSLLSSFNRVMTNGCYQPLKHKTRARRVKVPVSRPKLSGIEF
jgi:hypothetical protein